MISTPEEFTKTLENWFDEQNPRWAGDYYDFWSWGNFEHCLKDVKIGTLRFEIVDSKDTGTREDFTDPEPVYFVVAVTDTGFEPYETVYFRRDGVVQSWDSDEMSDWYKVTPTQKTITVYE